MYNGVIVFYFPFFSNSNYSADNKVIDLQKIDSWRHIDGSFHNYFINIFSKSSKIVSNPGGLHLEEDFDYNDGISNVLFEIETGLKFKSYKYLNTIKCSYSCVGLELNELLVQLKTKKDILFKKLIDFKILEFQSTTDESINRGIFDQKLRIHFVVEDTEYNSPDERKFVLLDLALNQNKNTSKSTLLGIQSVVKPTHTKTYLDQLLNKSLIDQYHNTTSLTIHKKFVTIFVKNPEANLSDIYCNHTVQFGLIYLQKIILWEFLNILKLWINENRFGNDMQLSKNYIGFTRKCDFDNISMKQLYNEYSFRLNDSFNIENDKNNVRHKIKEIENILDKEKNRTTNLLLLVIAILQVSTVFIEDLKKLFSIHFGIGNSTSSVLIIGVFLFICGVLFLTFTRNKRF
jgi:hypothetical protein